MAQVSLDQMVQALKAKPTLVSFPTDTVPALAAVPSQAGLIFEAKQRSPEKPLILMGASLSDLLPYVSGPDTAMAEWQSIALRHWPGQLTLVLPASDLAPKNLNPRPTADSAGTIGIRVPDHPIALALLTQIGPLATTSANLSGQPALTDVSAIAKTFPNALTLKPAVLDPAVLDPAALDSAALDAAPNPKHSQSKTVSGMPSTVAKWMSPGWQILRQGNIRL
ncbi:L-threonylcarbamoyladenylate synthase [cf. Phormidesmis sp. LEGE 11477]|uniref:L-threonylcarbamoyladenylate synthase n=1 Tax=cf. Phormidesmis sp. LEGE 11477 TaxID=1828680 RepID=UPI001881F104|nr:L-threonylcarbamoyladenylate synthase [cf. Phormidesmis sp. LEGE 11477]MBE9061153.1 L-threonylcarbamoyladenylate synthase [cf. Phormidesmis sp. LEGE 11477]